MIEEEYFGDPSRLHAIKRAAELWKLLNCSEDYRYYGRAVGLNGPTDDTAERMAALARIQGVGICYYCPKERGQALFSGLATQGFQTDRHEHYRGGEAAYSFANEIVKNRSLPSDLNVVQLDRNSRRELVCAVAELCASEGVTPVPGSIMRGVSVPGVVFAALDGNGEPIASASSHQMTKPDFPRGSDVFWGALTTRPDRRGKGIALVLGAMAIIHMWEVHGARGFTTGVRHDNISSQKLCAKLGVNDTEWMIAQCIDTEILGSKRHTK